MLDFHVDLEGTFLHNVRTYKALMNMCAREDRPFKEAIKIVRERFADLTELQFLELRYEMHELGCVLHSKSRNPAYDRFMSSAVRDMLDERNDAEFYAPKFIQVMGRMLRAGQGPQDLIGKEMRININNIKRKRNE